MREFLSFFICLQIIFQEILYRLEDGKKASSLIKLECLSLLLVVLAGFFWNQLI
jgi:hypothetical protein